VTQNIVHWGTGAGWGMQFGVVARSFCRQSPPAGLALGAAAWATAAAARLRTCS
jgi:hypothetical protein